MKLKDGFITHNTGSEQIMVSTRGDFNGLIRSNETAAFIIDTLKVGTTLEEIIDLVIERYDDISRESVKIDVENIINTLSEIGALDE